MVNVTLDEQTVNKAVSTVTTEVEAASVETKKYLETFQQAHNQTHLKFIKEAMRLVEGMVDLTTQAVQAAADFTDATKAAVKGINDINEDTSGLAGIE